MTNREAIEIIKKVDICANAAETARDMAIAALKATEWIPVSEPPKEKRKEYLCYYKYEPESPDVICENTYYGSGHWLSDGDKVTHWMPLPEAPKEN